MRESRIRQIFDYDCIKHKLGIDSLNIYYFSKIIFLLKYQWYSAVFVLYRRQLLSPFLLISMAALQGLNSISKNANLVNERLNLRSPSNRRRNEVTEHWRNVKEMANITKKVFLSLSDFSVFLLIYVLLI